MKRWMFVVGAVVIGMLACLPAQGGEWRLHLGPSFVSGFLDVADHYEEAVPHDTDFDWEVPVGLAFSAGYEFTHGFRVVGDIGPAGVIYVYEVNGDDEWSYVDIPISLSCGYRFVSSGNVSPYVRGGLRYHAVDGDFVDSSSPGLFGAFGMEFMREKPIGWGFEVAYDASSTEMENGEDIEPGAVLVGVFVSL